jgi:hypothetical protein
MSPFASFYAQQIQADLDWRELELAFLRKQLLQTIVGSTQETTLLRTNLAMIYAHYEGFCKFALGTYVDALEKLALKRVDLRWPIAAQSLRQLHSELVSVSDVGEFFKQVLTGLETHLNAKATYEKPENIANLWPALLVSWQKRLGLDATMVQQEFTRLESLVNSRNHIAHGKKLTVANRAELDKHADAATLAMHEVAIGITDALDKKLYVRSSQVQTIVPHAIS